MARAPNKTTASETAAARGRIGKPSFFEQLRGSGFAEKAVAVLIGVIATFFVGDLLLKRNYEAYLDERAAMRVAVQEASTNFDALLVDISKMVGDRVYASSLMNDYAAADNVSGFIRFYPQYFAIVQQWNNTRADVERRIRAVTGCEKATDDGAISVAIRSLLVKPDWPPNADARFASVPKISIDELRARPAAAR